MNEAFEEVLAGAPAEGAKKPSEATAGDPRGRDPDALALEVDDACAVHVLLAGNRAIGTRGFADARRALGEGRSDGLPDRIAGGRCGPRRLLSHR
jgi:hypothetical protein